MSNEKISKEYDKFEKELRDNYDVDIVDQIRDQLREYLVEYAEEYKDLIEKDWQDDEYADDVWEWVNDGGLCLFPIQYDVTEDSARKALDDMKVITQKFLDFLDDNGNYPDNIDEILPDRLL